MAVSAWALLVLSAASGGATPDEGSPAAASATRAIAGELTRVDLSHRSVVVKTDGREPRETDAAVRPETRVVSRGRALRLEDLHPGDRVIVLAAEEGGQRVARVIRVVGRASPALSPPSPAAPAPSASPATGGAAG